MSVRSTPTIMESIGSLDYKRQAPILGVPEAAGRSAGVNRAGDVMEMSPARLASDPGQPRKEFDQDGMIQMASSLRQHGQLQAIVAWWDEPAGVYRIVSGERRWRAATMIGLAKVAVKVLPGKPTSEVKSVLQLVENMHRHDLKPMEQAEAFRDVIAATGWSNVKLGEELGISDGQVAKILKLLTLPGEIREDVVSGKLSGATAYAVARIADPVEQAQVAREAAAGRMSRDDVAERAKRPGTPAKPAPIILPGEGLTITLRGDTLDRDSAIRRAIDILTRSLEVGPEH